MGKAGILLLGCSAIWWSNLCLHLFAGMFGRNPLLAMLASTAIHGYWMVKLFRDCKCDHKKQEDPEPSR
jgi:hypothetical protein